MRLHQLGDTVEQWWDFKEGAGARSAAVPELAAVFWVFFKVNGKSSLDVAVGLEGTQFATIL